MGSKKRGPAILDTIICQTSTCTKTKGQLQAANCRSDGRSCGIKATSSYSLSAHSRGLWWRGSIHSPYGAIPPASTVVHQKAQKTMRVWSFFLKWNIYACLYVYKCVYDGACSCMFAAVYIWEYVDNILKYRSRGTPASPQDSKGWKSIYNLNTNIKRYS